MTTGSRALLFALAVCLFGTGLRASALATEHFGNDPITQGYTADVLALANLPGRFYWFEVNGDPCFYYRGDAAVLNEALRKFAALRAPAREVTVLPGPGEGSSLTGEHGFGYDWMVHTPAGLGPGGPPTITVYVGTAAPSRTPDAAAVARWIAELDSESFAVRERASRELERVRDAAAPALRKAREGGPTPEARRRIDQILEGLRGIDLRRVEMPPGVTVLELTDLLERDRADLRSVDPYTAGAAAGHLGGLGRYADVVPDLVGLLGGQRHEYVRRCAASALCRLGKKAAPALPALKSGLSDPDVNVRNAFADAVAKIEGATDEPPAEDAATLRSTLDGISAFCRAYRAGPKK
jgi:hypothetical protein